MNRIVASSGPVIVHRLVLGGRGEGERRIWLCHDKIYPPPQQLIFYSPPLDILLATTHPPPVPPKPPPKKIHRPLPPANNMTRP